VSELAEYAKAMRSGDINAALRIENKHNLIGYPPEIVTVGLRAFDEGKDVNDAVDQYIGGQTP
jgi:hypothetical protein